MKNERKLVMMNDYGDMNCLTSGTDLVLEASEDIGMEDECRQGIRIEEKYIENINAKVTVIDIIDEKAAFKMGRKKGKYITVEAPALMDNDDEYHSEVTKELKRVIEEVIKAHIDKVYMYRMDMHRTNMHKTDTKIHILVAGLGNCDATPDALGPAVVSNLRITRNVQIEETKYIISAIAPNVMARTGMESAEILRGITDITHPDFLIVIDALAARNMERLGKTVQITDTGIAPGSGVMNRRRIIDEEVMGLPVIAIGVPTVIDVGTIIYDTICRISSESEAKELTEYAKKYSESMYVTPKDIDEYIKRTSYTISEAINGLSKI